MYDLMTNTNVLPVITAIIGAVSALVVTFITQLISSLRDKVRDRRVKEKEFFDERREVYCKLLKGVKEYRDGDHMSESLENALIWIYLNESEGLREFIDKWRREGFKRTTGEDVFWSYIRIDISDYYGKIMLSEHMGVFRFYWSSMIFRLWLSISCLWWMINIKLCGDVMKLIGANPLIWPFIALMLLFVVFFIGSGHKEIIYRGLLDKLLKKSLKILQ